MDDKQLGDVVRKKWGASWRMPTKSEFQELIDECKCEWVNEAGKQGYKFIGPNGNSLFLSAAGLYKGDSPEGFGECGNYWSSSPELEGGYRDWCLGFVSSYCGVYLNLCYEGLSVRGVSE